jgi:hypothetical protein
MPYLDAVKIKKQEKCDDSSIKRNDPELDGRRSLG